MGCIGVFVGCTEVFMRCTGAFTGCTGDFGRGAAASASEITVVHLAQLGRRKSGELFEHAQEG